MKKLLLCLCLLIPLLLATALASTVKDVDVQAILNSDGSMDVTETWTVETDKGNFAFSTGIGWGLDKKAKDAGLDGISVQIDGQECVLVENDSDDRDDDHHCYTKYSYPSHSIITNLKVKKANEEHTYVFKYTANGVVTGLSKSNPNYAGMELSFLYGTNVSQGTISLTLPEDAEPWGITSNGDYTLSEDRRTIQCSASGKLPKGYSISLSLNPAVIDSCTYACLHSLDRDLVLNSNGTISVNETYDYDCRGALPAIYYTGRPIENAVISIDDEPADSYFEITGSVITPKKDPVFEGRHLYKVLYTTRADIRSLTDNSEYASLTCAVQPDTIPDTPINVFHLTAPGDKAPQVTTFPKGYTAETEGSTVTLYGSAGYEHSYDADAHFSIDPTVYDEYGYWKKNTLNADVIVNADGTLTVTENWDITVHNIQLDIEKLYHAIGGRSTDYREVKSGTLGYFSIDSESKFVTLDNNPPCEASVFYRSDPLEPGEHRITVTYTVGSAVKYLSDGRTVLGLLLFESSDETPAEVTVHLEKDAQSGLYRPGTSGEQLTGPASTCVLKYDLDPAAFDTSSMYLISESAQALENAKTINEFSSDSLTIDVEVSATGDIIAHETLVLNVEPDGVITEFEHYLPSSETGESVELSEVLINGKLCLNRSSSDDSDTRVDPAQYSGFSYTNFWNCVKLSGVGVDEIVIEVSYTIRDAVRSYANNQLAYMSVDFTSKRTNWGEIILQLSFPAGAGATIEYNGWPGYVEKNGSDALACTYTPSSGGSSTSKDSALLLSFKNTSVFSGLQSLSWSEKTLKEKRHAKDWSFTILTIVFILVFLYLAIFHPRVLFDIIITALFRRGSGGSSSYSGGHSHSHSSGGSRGGGGHSSGGGAGRGR